MIQWELEDLLCKHGDMNSNPKDTHKQPGVTE